MRSVFPLGRVTAVALLLCVVLLAPSAFAVDAATDPNLWAEFTTWLQARLGVPNGITTVDEVSFAMWLMARLGIPNG